MAYIPVAQRAATSKSTTTPVSNPTGKPLGPAAPRIYTTPEGNRVTEDQLIQNINSAPKPQFDGLKSFGDMGSNIANGFAAPFLKMIGSGVRSIQSIPTLFKGGNPLSVKNQQAAEAIQEKPILGQKTLQGSTNAENLGSAAQVASLLVPETSLGPIAGGAAAGLLQGGGAAAENPDASAGDIAKGAVIGGATGGALGAAARFLPDWFSSLSTGKTATSPVGEAEANLATASKAREAVASKAVDAYNSMVEQTSGFKSALGVNFRTAADELTRTSPDLKLHLSGTQIDALNVLKESKSFALPDYIEKTSNPLGSGSVSADFAAKNADKLSKISDAGSVSLTPSQTQDLITQLNKGTFTAKASGQLAVNQQMIGVTNDIKAAASKAFGESWNKIYSDYAQGINAVQKIDDIVNLDKAATPSDMNKSMNSVLKLGETPEGKVLLRHAIQDYKNVSGVDLTDPVGAIHQIVDKQIALEEAQSGLTAAQKDAAKPGLVKQALNPVYMTRSIARGAITVGVLYPILRAIQKAMAGK
jgi:hypothetical protein